MLILCKVTFNSVTLTVCLPVHVYRLGQMSLCLEAGKTFAMSNLTSISIFLLEFNSRTGKTEPISGVPFQLGALWYIGSTG